MAKTIEEIQKKLDSNEAIVMTKEELKMKLKNDEEVSIEDVDVITCATSGVMSGTTALFHIPVAEPGSFTKAREVYINGIPAYPGPCPNELLGSVDVILYGTNHSTTIDEYGGGFLLKDLLMKKEVEVKVIDMEGNEFITNVTLDDMQTARIIGTRMAFKNYNSFTNPDTSAQKSIFNVSPMEGPYNSYSFSGCGDINPLQNDPQQDIIKQGYKVLLNGAEGIIIDNGTRSTPEKPNLLLTADMKEMNPYYMGGFKTGLGPEVFNTVAVAIPVLNEEILDHLRIINREIELPVCDIHGRHLPIDIIDYSIWDDAQLRPILHPDQCFHCIPCLCELYCPVNAFHKKPEIDNDLCYGCGYCSVVCPRGVPEIDMKQIAITVDDKEKTIPVTCRQSDKKRALKMAEELKDAILNGTYKL